VTVKKRIPAEIDRELSPEQARAYLSQPVTPEEREGVQDLVRWFCGRYPSPAERLAYVRQAYRRWTQAAGAPSAE
jgi:hypothetical protein